LEGPDTSAGLGEAAGRVNLTVHHLGGVASCTSVRAGVIKLARGAVRGRVDCGHGSTEVGSFVTDGSGGELTGVGIHGNTGSGTSSQSVTGGTSDGTGTIDLGGGTAVVSVGHSHRGAVVVHLVALGSRGKGTISTAQVVGSRGIVTEVASDGGTGLGHIQSGATNGGMSGSDGGTEIGLRGTGGGGSVLTGTFEIFGTLASRLTSKVLVTSITGDGASSTKGTSTTGSKRVDTNIVGGTVGSISDALNGSRPGTRSGAANILSLGVVTDVTLDLAPMLEGRVFATLGDMVTSLGSTEVGDLSAGGDRGPGTGADNTRVAGGTGDGGRVGGVTSFARDAAGVTEFGSYTRGSAFVVRQSGTV